MRINRPYQISSSPIHGVGVFAKRMIKSGEVYRSPCFSYVRQGKFAGYNHSCNFNVLLVTIGKDSGWDVALRDIKRGEELTVDYSHGGDDPPIVKCNCKNKNCRWP